MAGQRWPVCVLAGGALAAVACDVQARRWRAPLLDAATIIAIGLALTGVAALVPVPVGVLGAVAGCALLLARRDTAAATFALAGAATPVLVALAEQRVGAGTLDRIGATGEVLTWSAPLAGVVAGLVLAVVATRRDAAPLAVAALAAPAIGIVTGLGTGDVDAAVWASLPGLVLVALEAVAALAPTGPWRRVSTPAADVVAAVSAAAALGAPADRRCPRRAGPAARAGRSRVGDDDAAPVGTRRRPRRSRRRCARRGHSPGARQLDARRGCRRRRRHRGRGGGQASGPVSDRGIRRVGSRTRPRRPPGG